ncbi:MAG: PIN domain-containing protein [Deltaproteobacteria bacterium]|nr:PIN domain-containing protein [Deltaproteobacteria bacterium]
MRNLILDAGPFVALLDSSERNHERCVNFFKEFHGQVFTTEPVLTEVLYLLGPSIRDQRAAIEFILRGGAILVPQSLGSLKRAMELMAKYKDVPMDFADSTLVVLAEEMGASEIFSLDMKGFGTYRIYGKKGFKVWPE